MIIKVTLCRRLKRSNIFVCLFKQEHFLQEHLQVTAAAAKPTKQLYHTLILAI